MRGLSGQSLFFAVVVAASLLVGGYLIFSDGGGPFSEGAEGVSKLTLDDIPADAFRSESAGARRESKSDTHAAEVNFPGSRTPIRRI